MACSDAHTRNERHGRCGSAPASEADTDCFRDGQSFRRTACCYASAASSPRIISMDRSIAVDAADPGARLGLTAQRRFRRLGTAYTPKHERGCQTGYRSPHFGSASDTHSVASG